MTPKQLIRTYLREEYGLSDYKIRKKLNLLYHNEDENTIYLYPVESIMEGVYFYGNIDRFMRWNVRRQRYLKLKKIQQKL